MKTSINKSAKRVLSFVIAIALIAGTLFTANAGVTISTMAATDPTAEKTVVYWDGSNGTFPTKGTGTEADPLIIETPAQLHYVACASGPNNTTNKYFKVADNMVFVLQPATVITDLDAFKQKSATEVKSFFQGASGKVNWLTSTYPAVFNGNFDGNGVEIYGLYSDGASISGQSAGSDSSALFPNVDGGGDGTGTSSNYITDDVGITFKNFLIQGSYLIGIRRVGVVTGTSQWAKGGAYVEGLVNMDGLVVANNYVEGLCNYTAGDGTAVTQSRTSGEMGVLVGASGNDPTTATNCLIYGNESLFTAADGTTNTFCLMAGNASCARSYTTNVTVYGGLKNSLVMGTSVCTSCTNNANVTAGVYGDTLNIGSSGVAITETKAKGELGRTYLGAFNWADMAENPNDGNTYWYARENDYPTPICPADDYWKSVDATSIWSGAAAGDYAGGTGTKDDPYIIKTAEQLYSALSTVTYTTSTEGDLAVETAENVAGGYQSSRIYKQGSTTVYAPVYTPYYYKVADGIDAIYLNDILTDPTLSGIKSLVSAGTALVWDPAKSFVGHLDGNGVTIYGLYGTLGRGLIYKLDGSATVKNINFDSCYQTSTGNCGILTTNLGSYANDSTIINVANISVRNSYIATTRNVAPALNSSSGYYEYAPGAGGIIGTQSTAELLCITNCLFDGISCERAIGSSSTATADMLGGIISGGNGMNNVHISNSVALGAPVVDEVYISGQQIFYNRYDKNQGYEVHFFNSYTTATNTVAEAYPDLYEKLSDIDRISVKDVYARTDLPKLGWTNWSLVTDGSRTIPMPIVSTTDIATGSYSNIIGEDYGNHSSVGPYEKGSNPLTYLLKGSGTAEDPFLIETDMQLARAIATGGMNLYDKLYYKLANDIDISSAFWINQTNIKANNITYTYTPFAGTLDGDGHVITGLNAGDGASAALIPVLAGGTVKDLHIRNANVVSSTYAGAIAGEVQTGSTITGCSVENCDIEGVSGTVILAGAKSDTYDNNYYITTAGDEYYMANGVEYDETNYQNIFSIDSNKDTWYIGGLSTDRPKLKNLFSHANDLDISGDGKNDSYGAGDLTALRNKILRKSAYANINGDISRNGVVNLSDLAILQRSINSDYATGEGAKITDSFFSNVKAGMVKIYYGENDNYDAARKVELYLESLFPTTDIIKCVSASSGVVEDASSDSSKVYLHAGDEEGTPDGQLEIIVGNIDNYSAYAANTVATADNTYAVTYDATNKVVWLQGANFTAVEQAAINFTEGCDVQGDVVYNCGSTELEDYKKPVTVTLDTNFDGVADKDTVHYYAWGDEFDEDTINTHNWQFNSQQCELQNGTLDKYTNQEIAPVKDMSEMITIEDGHLYMKRGHDITLRATDDELEGSIALSVTPGEFNGYYTDGVNAIDADGSDQYFSSGKITSDRGMLFKQGYIEMKGRFPADGHAFPAWWLMARPTQNRSNSGYDTSLYSKIYKYNTNWNGENAMESSNMDTYKYQIPTAIYEIDMIEVMQDASRSGVLIDGTGYATAPSYYGGDEPYERTTANAWYMMNSTIHKWWDNGYSSTNDLLYVHDWDNYQVLGGGISVSDFASTSDGNSWIHNIGTTQFDFGTPTVRGSLWYGYPLYYSGDPDGNVVDSDNNVIQAASVGREYLSQERVYGFSWYTDSVSGFEATLYIYDLEDDGVTKTLIGTLPIASGGEFNEFLDANDTNEANGILGTSGALGADKTLYNDAEVFNQYMFILLDNKYYSSNNTGYRNGEKDSTVQYTDLLTSVGLKNLIVDYVRVYQQAGRRDIVTQDTQNFNNNNHFGY